MTGRLGANLLTIFLILVYGCYSEFFERLANIPNHRKENTERMDNIPIEHYTNTLCLFEVVKNSSSGESLFNILKTRDWHYSPMIKICCKELVASLAATEWASNSHAKVAQKCNWDYIFLLIHYMKFFHILTFRYVGA